MASERLKELQEMERELQRQAELGEIQAAPTEVSLGAGSFRVEDAAEAGDNERRSLLRRQAAAREKGRGLEAWKVWSVVGITILSCLLLLWALFSGASPDKFVGSSPASKPLGGGELAKLHQEGTRPDACPDPWWLPEECLDERRTKSKTEMDRCNQIFQDLDYSLELLTKCGLITVNG